MPNYGNICKGGGGQSPFCNFGKFLSFSVEAVYFSGNVYHIPIIENKFQQWNEDINWNCATTSSMGWFPTKPLQSKPFFLFLFKYFFFNYNNQQHLFCIFERKKYIKSFFHSQNVEFEWKFSVYKFREHFECNQINCE